uniref:alpha-1,2-Mannosidase n=1 Tax=Glossina brevipalpis TaxID=37001 RepID=A0A1A9X3F2_9MUSC
MREELLNCDEISSPPKKNRIRWHIYLSVICVICLAGIFLFSGIIDFGIFGHRQLPFGGHPDSNENVDDKRTKIQEMMEHAWDNYKLYAWGKNELLKPSLQTHMESSSNDMGTTIVDSLDTLYIMGLQTEYKEGREWIKRNFNLRNINEWVSVSEMNTRFVGSFLTLYAFTGDDMYKKKAIEVADKLLPAFWSTGIPYNLIYLENGSFKNYDYVPEKDSILAEIGSLYLEFNYLSEITGNSSYKEKVQTIRDILRKLEKPNGLYSSFLNPATAQFGKSHISLGAFGGTFYEYLLKAWLQSNQTDKEARQMFDDAMLAIIKDMTRTSTKGLIYIPDLKSGHLGYKMNHSACFAGGLFALAANTSQDENSMKFMDIAENIAKTCHQIYISSYVGLGPEVFRFTPDEDRPTNNKEKAYLLRPETVESLFYLWRITHDEKYREWAWDIVLALEEYCRTPYGFTGILDVNQDRHQKDNVQHSYFLGETLKYLYLLFSDDSLIPLREWVFNAAAHPLPIKGVNKYYRPHY